MISKRNRLSIIWSAKAIRIVCRDMTRKKINNCHPLRNVSKKVRHLISNVIIAHLTFHHNIITTIIIVIMAAVEVVVAVIMDKVVPVAVLLLLQLHLVTSSMPVVAITIIIV